VGEQAWREGEYAADVRPAGSALNGPGKKNLTSHKILAATRQPDCGRTLGLVLDRICQAERSAVARLLGPDDLGEVRGAPRAASSHL
jgi:hypothetical protein